MGLTFRNIKGSPLTFTELDDNFAYFTGSYTTSGSLTVSPGNNIIVQSGSVIITGSITISGSSITDFGNQDFYLPPNSDNPHHHVMDYTGNTSLFMVTGSGAVGINEFHPQHKLHVTETGSADPARIDKLNAGGTYLVTTTADGVLKNSSGSIQIDPDLNLFIFTGSMTITGGNTLHNFGPMTTGHPNLVASGFCSMAQGSQNSASGEGSHAEGLLTRAIGIGSHTEGNRTYATGSYSHAEGFSTSASADYQHVQGQYNLVSPFTSSFVVGNGTSNSSRKNLIHAYTKDGTGKVEITGSFFVNSLTTGGTQVVTYDPTTKQFFSTASDAVGAGGSQFITGSLNVVGNSEFSGSTIFSGSDTDTVTVVGKIRQTGSMDIKSGSIFIDPDTGLPISGSVTITGSLTVIGPGVISGSHSVIGSNSTSGSLTVTGSTNITGSTSVIGNSTISGSTVLQGFVHVTGSLGVTGSSTLFCDSPFNGGISATNTLGFFQTFVYGQGNDFTNAQFYGIFGSQNKFDNSRFSLVMDGLVAGRGNTISDFQTSAFGQLNSASAQHSFVGGRGNQSLGKGGTVFGFHNTLTGSNHGVGGDSSGSNASYGFVSGIHNSAVLYNQTVFGAFNMTSSHTGSFIYGNGVDGSRSNLMHLYGTKNNGVVEITGSLKVSGSTFIDKLSSGGSDLVSVNPVTNQLFTIATSSLTSATASYISGANVDGCVTCADSASYFSGSTTVVDDTGVTVIDRIEHTGSMLRSGSLINVGPIETTGNLIVTGSQIVSGSITLIGDDGLLIGNTAVITPITQVGNLTITGSQQISGSINNVGPLTNTGDLAVTGKFEHTGSMLRSGSISMNGISHFTGSILATGSITLIGDDGLIIGNTAVVTPITQVGNLTITGSQQVSGSISLDVGNLTVATGTTSLGSTPGTIATDITGSIVTTGSIISVGPLTNIGDVVVTGSQAISGTTFQMDNNLAVIKFKDKKVAERDPLLGNTAFGDTSLLTIIQGTGISVTAPTTVTDKFVQTGSMLRTGSLTNIGPITTVGDMIVTGSQTVSGSITLVGPGSLTVAGPIVQGDAPGTIASQITGALEVTGSINGIGPVDFNGNLVVTGSVSTTGVISSVTNNEEGSINLLQVDNSLVVGTNPTVSASNVIAGGQDNQVHGLNSLVVGVNNSGSGANSIILGDSNNITAQTSIIAGANNITIGSHSNVAMFGAAGYVTGSASSTLVGGLNNTASGQYQAVLGVYNSASMEPVGTGGLPIDLFTVGNGLSNSNRRNALEVKLSGSLRLPTTSSGTPGWTGNDGEMIFANVSGNNFFYVWLNGKWNSGSLSN
jgi:hypothetical protein